MNPFTRFCSLGHNCEPGLVLRRACYPEQKDYFKWSATPFEVLVQAIETEFHGFNKLENLLFDGFMVIDQFNGAGTHKPSDSVLATFREENFEEDLLRFVCHDRAIRASSFMNEVRSGVPIAYLIAYINNDSKADAIRLRDLLMNNGASRSSKIIFVQESDRAEDPWNIDNVDNHYVSKFAPILDAEAFDFEAWRTILTQYDC